MINVISQPLGLDLININVYANVYQNIPNGLRVMDIFHFLTGDKIFAKIKGLSIVQTLKVNLQLLLTFLGLCNSFVFAAQVQVLFIVLFLFF